MKTEQNIHDNTRLDNDLRSLFDGYRPTQTSDFRFMARLKQNLDSVELIKQHNARERAINRRSVVFASLAGFVCGLAFSMFIPNIITIFSAIAQAYPEIDLLNIIATDYSAVISWIIAAGLSVLCTLQAYDISRSILLHRANASNS